MTQSLSQFIKWYRENALENHAESSFIELLSKSNEISIRCRMVLPDIVAALEEAKRVMLARIHPTESNYGNADFLAREFLKKYFPEEEL